MNIEELINKHYKNGKFNYDVSQNELSAFVKEFILINKLKDKYNNGECNRKDLGNEILIKVKDLKRLMDIFGVCLSKDNTDYEYPEYISDYNKVFELLLALSNEEKSEYAFKKFSANQLGSYETRHGDRESLVIDGEILVIGRHDILNCIDNSKPYYGAEFGKLITKIVNEGNSIVITTNYRYTNNVMPHFYETKGNHHQFNVAGLISDLCCFTFEDRLGSAVKKLNDYIDIYGGNIENISIDTIISRIKGLNNSRDNKQKILSAAGIQK